VWIFSAIWSSNLIMLDCRFILLCFRLMYKYLRCVIANNSAYICHPKFVINKNYA
jgi:hypothetical protein